MNGTDLLRELRGGRGSGEWEQMLAQFWRRDSCCMYRQRNANRLFSRHEARNRRLGHGNGRRRAACSEATAPAAIRMAGIMVAVTLHLLGMVSAASMASMASMAVHVLGGGD
ncbi:MAG: hypothetical protein M3Z30_12370 [Gemmatimonadota bacterium]|nr:hypothetical protein [Gemmatimonadota bacterium]